MSGLGLVLAAAAIGCRANLLGGSHDLPGTAATLTGAPRTTCESLVATDHASRAMEWVKVSGDRSGFVLAPSGKKFTPWGFNCDRDYKSRLLEDYWDSERANVVEDFREMKQLGANVVRVHLQFARFMEATNQPNAKALEHLGWLVKLAEDTGLYLDLTGLACYRKADVPGWYTGLSEPERWEAQACFWEAVAGRCAGSPAVFCYDLMNEPIVPGGKRKPGDWLVGELGGFVYCQFISLDQAGRKRPDIAREWIARLTAAIRRSDQRHLITVGLLPSNEKPESMSGFVPERVADLLDFLCVHIYPKTGHLKEDLELLHGFKVGKPVVIEEIFPMNCSSEELGRFIQRSKQDAAGWIGFYWGQTPAELEKSSDLGAVLTRGWLKLFEYMNPASAALPVR